jgi:hypothetical protein
MAAIPAEWRILLPQQLLHAHPTSTWTNSSAALRVPGGKQFKLAGGKAIEVISDGNRPETQVACWCGLCRDDHVRPQ